MREATVPNKRVATGHSMPSGGGGAESAIATGVVSLAAVLNDSVTNMKAFQEQHLQLETSKQVTVSPVFVCWEGGGGLGVRLGLGKRVCVHCCVGV